MQFRSLRQPTVRSVLFAGLATGGHNNDAATPLTAPREPAISTARVSWCIGARVQETVGLVNTLQSPWPAPVKPRVLRQNAPILGRQEGSRRRLCGIYHCNSDHGHSA